MHEGGTECVYLLIHFPPDAEPDGPYEVAAYVQDVLALIDHLTEQPAILIGHDWGAAAARSTAILAPASRLGKTPHLAQQNSQDVGLLCVAQPT